jgi:cell division protein FtsW
LGELIKKQGDAVIISTAAALILLGILFIYSSSGPFCKFMDQPKPTWYFLLRQAVWALAGFMVMFFMYRLDYKLVIKISPVLMILSVIMLIMVFFLSGAAIKRWIYVGGFAFQPSEFFKIAMAAFLARIAGKNIRRVDFKAYAPSLALILFGILLILREPDLGTSALILAVAGAALYLSGFRKRYLAILPALGALVMFIMVFQLGYEKDRIDSYAETIENPFNANANYQTRQSMVSFGSGGLIGKGLANGGQKHLFLPERHTDFILSAAAEEGGFVLVASIFMLFGLFAATAFKIANNAPTVEGSMLAWGLALVILLQATVNIGVALGLLPVTGMTLPFLSYGGSSLVSCCAAVGMIASVARRTRSPRRYFNRMRAS